MKRKNISNVSNEKLVEVAIDIMENYECLESFEGGTCNIKEILGYDCNDNDNHCVAKEVLREIVRSIPT